MSDRSNKNGRAYEYAVMNALNECLSNKIETFIVKNSSLKTNKDAWGNIKPEKQKTFIVSSQVAMNMLIDLEPLLENDEFLGKLILAFQSDQQGIKGDVRDIVITREKSDWEIGLSVKHNHEAVKHSRLSKELDFGKTWYDIPCSDNYWSEVKPIFDFLEKQKDKEINWRDIDNKEQKVYVPLLNAFIREIEHVNKKDPSFIKRLFSYFVGLKDYYKIISKDKAKVTLIESFNINSTLNKDAKEKKAAIVTPALILPTELVAVKLRNNSNTTVDMYMDSGWQFSFRLHNASSKVETSLKFDIKFQALPPEVMTFKIAWNKEKGNQR